jgi:hypothetical protein
MCARLYLVAGDKFSQHRRALSRIRLAIKRSFDIDKAHSEFDAAFRRMPDPLPLVIRGDVQPGGEPAFISPELVQRIAPVLETIDWEDLVRQLRPLGYTWLEREEEQSYYLLTFQALKDAYRTAAREGAALAVLIC